MSERHQHTDACYSKVPETEGSGEYLSCGKVARSTALEDLRALLQRPHNETCGVNVQGNYPCDCWKAKVQPIIEKMEREQHVVTDIAGKITKYLSMGGLFNPEMAEHNNVRDLLIDCRRALASCEGGGK